VASSVWHISKPAHRGLSRLRPAKDIHSSYGPNTDVGGPGKSGAGAFPIISVRTGGPAALSRNDTIHCAWLRTYKITARRTQTGEDKIAVVINLATRVQQAFFEELSETTFNLIGGITRQFDGRVVGRDRDCATLER